MRIQCIVITLIAMMFPYFAGTASAADAAPCTRPQTPSYMTDPEGNYAKALKEFDAFTQQAFDYLTCLDKQADTGAALMARRQITALMAAAKSSLQLCKE